MVERSWSFQNRKESSGDNGNDFERFVLECFRVAKEEAAFVKSLRRGRDGAIDLIDQHSAPGTTTVAECKYIGNGGFDEAKSRWREVYRHLYDYLPKLCADSGKTPNSPYRTWLDSARPIRRYRFCVSVKLTNIEVIQLEKLIAEDFAKLAGEGVEPLRHLAETEGAVRVLSWDWFHRELTTWPSLAFRWFRGLPIGVTLFDESGRSGQSFRSFLTGGELSYFSRDNFTAQNAGTVARGEADLLDDLISGTRSTLVLAGPGGVGKTRLAHELAITMTEKVIGCDAYWLDRSASASSVSELAQSYPAKSSILFLVDYAETAQRLGEVADMVSHLIEQGGHKVWIIATCRASATNRVRADLDILEPEIMHLASQRGGEGAYLEWVTQSIIALEPFPEPHALAKVCHGIPALAAFAVYLFRRDRSQFEEQFGALWGSDDFQSWSNKRISSLIKNAAFTERTLAKIALALPIPPDRQAAFKQEHGDLIDRLVTDRWIEHIDGHIAAAHDILADTLLARWLFEAENSTTARVIDLLEAAAYMQDLPHALTVLARLASHPAFDMIDGSQTFRTLLVTYPEQVATSSGQLLNGRLLQIQDKLDLIANSPAVAQAISGDSSLQASVAQLAEQVTYAREHGAAPTVPNVFEHLLDIGCSQSDRSNFILRRAFAFDPQRFRERAFANISLFPTAEQTQFLIGQMLRSGESQGAMREAVCNWLTLNGSVARASFVYNAWLDAAGDKEAVSAKLLEWVDLHGLSPEAQFVYKAWLDTAGDKEAVSAKLLEWVGLHGLSPEARFVYKAWLDTAGDKEAVSAKLLEWVGLHGLSPEARFVYNAWLDAAGDKEAVSAKLLEWVDLHGLSPEASHVYNAWLDAAGDKEAVSAKLLEWVDLHGLSPEASHVYNAWLDAAGDKEAVSAKLLEWVDLHGLSPEAQFVYKAWLDTAGDKEAVSAKLLEWVGLHGLSPEARFVYKAWLDTAGDKEAVSAKLLEWVGLHGLSPEARFVYKAWLDAAGDKEAVSAKLLEWSENFATLNEADFIFRSWLKAGGAFEKIKEHCEVWLREHWREEKAVYLTKELSLRREISFETVLRIVAWSGLYCYNEDAVFRLSRVGRHFTNGPRAGRFTKLVCRATRAVFEQLTLKDKLSRPERDACSILFGNLANSGYPRDENWFTIIEVYCAGIRHGNIFRHFERMPSATWVVLLQAALEFELLDPIIDQAAVAHADELIRQAMPPQEYADLIANSYRAPPSDVLGPTS